LGPTIELPRKRDAKAWARLRDEISHLKSERAEEWREGATRRSHELEQRVLDLKSRPQSKQRDVLIKTLGNDSPCSNCGYALTRSLNCPQCGAYNGT